MSQVIQRCLADGCRDRQRQLWPALTRKAENDYCQTLLGFWKEVSVDDVTIAACDRYHAWRTSRLKRGTGDRTVDLELNALNNAFLWACRCELVRHNPLAVRRPRYTSERRIQHCRKFMPADAGELHMAAGLLFGHPDSVVLGWQLLVEGCTGLRTAEALRLRTDASPHTPGWITPDGKSLCVWRCKGQDGVNPFAAIHDGLKNILDALFRWKREHHPASPWFFPSPRESGAVVDKSALAHALARIRPKLPRKIISHGARAFYVTVRRSHGVMDSQIAWEIGHTSGGATLAEVYGGAPPHWLAGDGTKMSWLPSGKPAWSVLWPAENVIPFPTPPA